MCNKQYYTHRGCWCLGEGAKLHVSVSRSYIKRCCYTEVWRGLQSKQTSHNSRTNFVIDIQENILKAYRSSYMHFIGAAIAAWTDRHTNRLQYTSLAHAHWGIITYCWFTHLPMNGQKRTFTYLQRNTIMMENHMKKPTSTQSWKNSLRWPVKNTMPYYADSYSFLWAYRYR